MSLFKAFSNALQGKPIYPSNDATNQADPALGQQPEPSVGTSAGAMEAKTPPVVFVSKMNVHQNGNNCRADVIITNSSSEPVEIRRLQFGEHERELEYSLRPGQSFDVPLYDGPLLENTRNETVLLTFKTENGHYFVSTHDVRYTFESSNNGYILDEVRLCQPISLLRG